MRFISALSPSTHPHPVYIINSKYNIFCLYCCAVYIRTHILNNQKNIVPTSIRFNSIIINHPHANTHSRVNTKSCVCIILIYIYTIHIDTYKMNEWCGVLYLLNDRVFYACGRNASAWCIYCQKIFESKKVIKIYIP